MVTAAFLDVDGTRTKLLCWLRADSELLLDVVKRAVEVAIEQDEQAALDFIAARVSNNAL